MSIMSSSNEPTVPVRGGLDVQVQAVGEGVQVGKVSGPRLGDPLAELTVVARDAGQPLRPDRTGGPPEEAHDHRRPPSALTQPISSRTYFRAGFRLSTGH